MTTTFKNTEGTLVFSNTSGIELASGTTAQRPSSAAPGLLRWNTSTTAAELFDGSVWGSVLTNNTTLFVSKSGDTMSGNLVLAANAQIVLDDAGTASLPALVFDTDTDTGLYRIGANNIGVSLGGALKLNINTDVTVNLGSLIASQDGAATGSSIKVTGDATQTRSLFFQTTGNNRWEINANNTTEAGTDSGSDLDITSYTDAGAVKTTIARIIRQTGSFSVYTNISMGANAPIFADPNGNASVPSYSFVGDSNTGMYQVAADTIGFTVGGVGAMIIDPDGTLRSANTTYETLVTADDDIPNKKYVDDQIAGINYVQIFNATTDWGTAVAGFYTITILGSVHTRGVNPVIQVYSGTTNYDYVLPDRIRINSSTGDVSIRVSDVPDNRFAGKIVIS